MNARTLHPVALADQLGAATAHARHILTSAADHGRAVLDANPPAEWLAAQATAIRAAILNRTARCCPHIGAAPQLLRRRLAPRIARLPRLPARPRPQPRRQHLRCVPPPRSPAHRQRRRVRSCPARLRPV